MTLFALFFWPIFNEIKKKQRVCFTGNNRLPIGFRFFLHAGQNYVTNGNVLLNFIWFFFSKVTKQKTNNILIAKHRKKCFVRKKLFVHVASLTSHDQCNIVIVNFNNKMQHELNETKHSEQLTKVMRFTHVFILHWLFIFFLFCVISFFCYVSVSVPIPSLADRWMHLVSFFFAFFLFSNLYIYLLYAIISRLALFSFSLLFYLFGWFLYV